MTFVHSLRAQARRMRSCILITCDICDRPITWDLHAIGTMSVFSYIGPYLSNFSFVIHVFISRNLSCYLFTKAKCNLLRRNQPFLTSVSIYVVSADASAWTLLLWVLITILTSLLFKYGCIGWSTDQRRTFCASYPVRNKLQGNGRPFCSVFMFISRDSTFFWQ